MPPRSHFASLPVLTSACEILRFAKAAELKWLDKQLLFVLSQ